MLHINIWRRVGSLKLMWRSEDNLPELILPPCAFLNKFMLLGVAQVPLIPEPSPQPDHCLDILRGP